LRRDKNFTVSANQREDCSNWHLIPFMRNDTFDDASDKNLDLDGCFFGIDHGNNVTPFNGIARLNEPLNNSACLHVGTE
jgi:hypothetical protein